MPLIAKAYVVSSFFSAHSVTLQRRLCLGSIADII
jgi:hypothetical protein